MLPLLQDVELLDPHPDQIQLLASLPPLDRLVIRNLYTATAIDLAWKEINNLIARSQDTLRELELADVQPKKQDSSIQDVLSDATGLPIAFPKLNSLHLDVCMALLSTSTILPQLSSLQSLSLMNSIFNRASAQEVGSVFSALKQSNIHLRRVCGPESLGLIEYLASYEGVLQEVEIEDWDPITSGPSVHRTTVNLALQFWQEVVPKHHSTLKSIRLWTMFDDFWAFGNSDATTSMFVKPLPRLEQVYVGVLMTVNKFVSVNHRVLCSTKTLMPSVPY
jgi:hypothetical protein